MPAVDFAWQKELPIFSDTPSPYCVTCGKHECNQSFLNIISDAAIRSRGGALLDFTAGYLCYHCAKKTCP